MVDAPGSSDRRASALAHALERLREAERLFDAAKRICLFTYGEAAIEAFGLDAWLDIVDENPTIRWSPRDLGPEPAEIRDYRRALDCLDDVARRLAGHPLTTDLADAAEEARALPVELGIVLMQEIAVRLRKALHDELMASEPFGLPDWWQHDDAAARARAGWSLAYVLAGAAIVVVASVVLATLLLG